MAKIYTIVKKKTAKHLEAAASFGKANIINLGKHVLVPSQRTVSYGHKVSHAKNKTTTRRMQNMRVLHVLVDGAKKAIRLSSGDLRTFKKLNPSE